MNRQNNTRPMVNSEDLKTLLEVSKKATQLKLEMIQMNEELLEEVQKLQNQFRETLEIVKSIKSDSKDILKKHDDLSKDVFKLTILWVTGCIGLIAQCIAYIIKAPK